MAALVNEKRSVPEVLQGRIEELNKEQVDLRAEMNQQALDQDKLLLNARLTSAEAKLQLNQRQGTIDLLEGQLSTQIQERDGLIVQINSLNDKVEQSQDWISDLRARLGNANQRIEDLGNQLVFERANCGKHGELLGIYGRISHMQERATVLSNYQLGMIGTGSTIGAVLGTATPAGGLGMGTLGFFAFQGIATFISECLFNPERTALSSELGELKPRISQLSYELRMPYPKEIDAINFFKLKIS